NDAELIGAFEERLSRLLGRMGDEQENTLQHAQAALQLWKQLDDWDRQLHLTGVIGATLLAKNEFDQAHAYLNAALTRSQELGHLAYIAQSQQGLADYYARLGDHDEALRCYLEALAT